MKKELMSLIDFEISNDDFLKSFEELWIAENVRGNYNLSKKTLNNKQYIVYKAWCQLNSRRLYQQYLPKIMVMSGSMDRTDMIIFHGGCQGCKSQHLYGVMKCTGCTYFQFNFSLPDISINQQGFIKT